MLWLPYYENYSSLTGGDNMAYEVRRRAGIIGLDIVEVSIVIVFAEKQMDC